MLRKKIHVDFGLTINDERSTIAARVALKLNLCEEEERLALPVYTIKNLFS